MGSTVAAEKTEEELRKEIDELHRQQREVHLSLYSFMKTFELLFVPTLTSSPCHRLQSDFAIPGGFAAVAYRAPDLAILPSMAAVSVASFDRYFISFSPIQLKP